MFNTPIVPVIVIDSSSQALPLGKSLIEGKLPVAEVTMRTEAAIDSIKAMAEINGLAVGAGTVLSADQALAAIDAGAEFLVSPGIHENVIRCGQQHNIPVIPGVTSPSEIAKAMDLGIELVKFFPAEPLGGVNLLNSLCSVYPGMQFMPTGGIHLGNIADYLAIPNVIACGGSWMVPSSALKAGNFSTITTLVKEAVELTTPAQR